MINLQTKAAPALSHVAQGRTMSAVDRSDAALLTLIARDDRDAMRILFGRHKVKVFRFLLRLVRDEALAEDLMSEVFVEVWRHAGRFEARSQVATWLLGIARHKALSALRRRTTDAINERALESIVDPSGHSRGRAAESGNRCAPLRVLQAVVGRTSGDHRSGLLP